MTPAVESARERILRRMESGRVVGILSEYKEAADAMESDAV